MTALTQPPGRLLSVADYAALSEDDRNRWELQEGNLVMSPSPTPRHMVIAAELYVQLRSQLPGNLRAVPDVAARLSPPRFRSPLSALGVSGLHAVHRRQVRVVDGLLDPR